MGNDDHKTGNDDHKMGNDAYLMGDVPPFGRDIHSLREDNPYFRRDVHSLREDDHYFIGDIHSLRGDDGSVGGDHSRKAFILFAKIVKASNKIDVCHRQNVTAAVMEFIFF